MGGARPSGPSNRPGRARMRRLSARSRRADPPLGRGPSGSCWHPATPSGRCGPPGRSWPPPRHQAPAGHGRAGRRVLRHRAQPVGQRPAGQQPAALAGPRPEPGQRERSRPGPGRPGRFAPPAWPPRGACGQQGQPAERGRARQHEQDPERRRAAGRAAASPGQADRHDEGRLQHLHGQHGASVSGRDQLRGAQRRRAEPLTRTALEPGRDGLAGERRDRMASARMPGARKSIRRPGRS